MQYKKHLGLKISAGQKSLKNWSNPDLAITTSWHVFLISSPIETMLFGQKQFANSNVIG